MGQTTKEGNYQKNISRYVGVYSDGMKNVVITELGLLNYIPEKHYHDHRIIIFSLEASNKDNEILPLCFLYLFQLIGEHGVQGYHYDPTIEIVKPAEKNEKKRCNNFKKKHRIKDEYAMEAATRILQTHLDQFCKEYFNFLHRPWKIVCKKQGNHAVSGEDICRSFGSLANSTFKEARDSGIEISSVSLTNSEVEVFIFISNSIKNESSSSSDKSDGCEKNPKCDTNKNIDLWFFGVRKTPDNSKKIEVQKK